MWMPMRWQMDESYKCVQLGWLSMRWRFTACASAKRDGQPGTGHWKELEELGVTVLRVMDPFPDGLMEYFFGCIWEEVVKVSSAGGWADGLVECDVGGSRSFHGRIGWLTDDGGSCGRGFWLVGEDVLGAFVDVGWKIGG